MPEWALTLAIGFGSGVLSGMFGIGGGALTTPALRMVLGTSALVAVGTPLPVIVPSAITGAIAYTRRGLADVRSGVAIALTGAPLAVAGAFSAARVGGRAVLVITAVLIVYMAVDMTLQALSASRAEARDADSAATRETQPPPVPTFARLAVLGVVTGFYSGFLGLGGGFILVPMLTRLFRFPIKRAVGTSLVAVGILAVPGTVSHYLLGNVDVRLAALLIVGVIPGALVGARITFGATERFVRVGFAALLGTVGLLLAANEFGWLG